MTQPYRRTRAVELTRTVAETHDGKTHQVQQPYTVHMPIPPRDWDQITLTTVTAIAVIIGAGCVAWSTNAIGSLLTTAAPAPIAYGGAATFDTLWITCMGLEWLARYEPDKAKSVHRASLLGLAVAMAALITEGWLGGHLAVGLIGACISAGTKRLWTYVLRHHAKPMGPLMQQWIEKEMGEVGGQLAMAAARRQLARSRAQLAAYKSALGGLPDPDKPSRRPDTVSATVRSAVRAALATMPDASPEEIVEQLARIGIDTDADTVRTLAGQPDGQQDSTSGALLQLAPHPLGESIADTVRRAVRDGVRDTDDVLIAVRRVHGPAVSRDTVAKTLRRVG